jgi:hypothetical protein
VRVVAVKIPVGEDSSNERLRRWAIVSQPSDATALAAGLERRCTLPLA